MIKLFLIMVLLGLTACSQTEPETVPVYVLITPPEALLHCRGAPAVPPRKSTQDDVSYFILRQAEAHADCEGKNTAIREYVEAAKAELEAEL